MAKAWKEAQKEVAKFFGGKSQSRGADFGQSIGDIIHDKYSIEVKWGKQIPKYLDVVKPTILLIGSSSFRLVPSEYLQLSRKGKRIWASCFYWEYSTPKSVDFLLDAFVQAKKYNPKLAPLVCVKPKRRIGFICAWEV